MPEVLPAVRFRDAITKTLLDCDDAGRALAERTDRDDLQAALTVIGWSRDAHIELDDKLSEFWSADRGKGFRKSGYDEVIIGGGLHAAIYCGVRKALGHPRPMVLEGSARVGGEFAVSRRPAFYLNSRNRPGKLALPGEGFGLNVLPGAVLQPSWLSDREFQRNNDLAYVIRTTLAAHARVRVLSKVIGISEPAIKRRYALKLSTGEVVFTDRVINATGFGTPIMPVTGNPHIISFREFMARMDNDFPLQGADRVAVVGDGDSGRCAIEALCGQGPGEHFSVPELDYPRKIDWYTGPTFPNTCAKYVEASRGRYRQIGTLIENKRIKIRQKRGRISDGYDCGIVNTRPYDLVIVCIGYEQDSNTPALGLRQVQGALVGDDYPISVKLGEIYSIGAVSAPAFTNVELDMPLAKIPANRSALFRLANRTAALAKLLG